MKKPACFYFVEKEIALFNIIPATSLSAKRAMLASPWRTDLQTHLQTHLQLRLILPYFATLGDMNSFKLGDLQESLSKK
jgi:hypothetical protein